MVPINFDIRKICLRDVLHCRVRKWCCSVPFASEHASNDLTELVENQGPGSAEAEVFPLNLRDLSSSSLPPPAPSMFAKIDRSFT